MTKWPWPVWPALSNIRLQEFHTFIYIFLHLYNTFFTSKLGLKALSLPLHHLNRSISDSREMPNLTFHPLTCSFLCRLAVPRGTKTRHLSSVALQRGHATCHSKEWAAWAQAENHMTSVLSHRNPKSRGSPHQAQEKRRWQQTQHAMYSWLDTLQCCQEPLFHHQLVFKVLTLNWKSINMCSTHAYFNQHHAVLFTVLLFHSCLAVCLHYEMIFTNPLTPNSSQQLHICVYFLQNN